MKFNTTKKTMSALKNIFPILLVLLTSCNSKTSSSILDSSNFDSPKERIGFLSKQIAVKSSIKDCDFELFNVNGFDDERFSVPGASSSDYKFGAIVNEEDLSKWTLGLKDTILKNYDFSWVLKLIQKRPENWSIHYPPKFYVNTDKNLTLLVYEVEGVIFERIIKE
ncbi:MAG: hypothetical protein QM737_23365 [Ferruginibacter sp.]